jgi:hypothetical protein
MAPLKASVCAGPSSRRKRAQRYGERENFASTPAPIAPADSEAPALGRNSFPAVLDITAFG